MAEFKSGDVVIDLSCTEAQFGNDGQGLIGVVSHVDHYAEHVSGDWRYASGWKRDMNSAIDSVFEHPDPDGAIFADWTAWRLLNG